MLALAALDGVQAKILHEWRQLVGDGLRDGDVARRVATRLPAGEDECPDNPPRQAQGHGDTGAEPLALGHRAHVGRRVVPQRVLLVVRHQPWLAGPQRVCDRRVVRQHLPFFGRRLALAVRADDSPEQVVALAIGFQPGDVHPVVRDEWAHGDREAVERRRRVGALGGHPGQAGQRVEQGQPTGHVLGTAPIAGRGKARRCHYRSLHLPRDRQSPRALPPPATRGLSRGSVPCGPGEVSPSAGRPS